MDWREAVEAGEQELDRISLSLECNYRIYNNPGLRKAYQNKEKWLSKVLALAKLKLREPENQKPVVHAHWIDDSGEGDAAVCSNCGECYDTTEAEPEWRKAFELFKQFYHYCPNCGAIMDEEV